MKGLLSLALMLTLVSACTKSATVVTKTYSGQYVLTGPNDLPITIKMHVQFSGVNFSGVGDSSLLPYVGNGVFKIDRDSIYFTQTGQVPETFSRNNILEGSFLLEKNADSLVFSRKNPTPGLEPKIEYRLQQD